MQPLVHLNCCVLSNRAHQRGRHLHAHAPGPSHFMFELGPRFGPPFTTLTKRRLYTKRFLARPVRDFFFSVLATFGVWFFTLPARAKLPCTLPIAACRASCCTSCNVRL